MQVTHCCFCGAKCHPDSMPWHQHTESCWVARPAFELHQRGFGIIDGYNTERPTTLRDLCWSLGVEAHVVTTHLESKTSRPFTPFFSTMVPAWAAALHRAYYDGFFRVIDLDGFREALRAGQTDSMLRDAVAALAALDDPDVVPRFLQQQGLLERRRDVFTL